VPEKSLTEVWGLAGLSVLQQQQQSQSDNQQAPFYLTMKEKFAIIKTAKIKLVWKQTSSF
jgi:hypothetical protein